MRKASIDTSVLARGNRIAVMVLSAATWRQPEERREGVVAPVSSPRSQV
jgi:hypothetical protein